MVWEHLAKILEQPCQDCFAKANVLQKTKQNL